MHRSKNKGLGVVTNLIMLAALAGAVNTLMNSHHEAISTIANKVTALLGLANQPPGKARGHQYGPHQVHQVLANTTKTALEGAGSLRIR